MKPKDKINPRENKRLEELAATPRTDALWKPQKFPSYAKEGEKFIYLYENNCRDYEYEFARTLERETIALKLALANASKATERESGLDEGEV